MLLNKPTVNIHACIFVQIWVVCSFSFTHLFMVLFFFCFSDVIFDMKCGLLQPHQVPISKTTLPDWFLSFITQVYKGCGRDTLSWRCQNNLYKWEKSHSLAVCLLELIWPLEDSKRHEASKAKSARFFSSWDIIFERKTSKLL